MVLPHGSNQKDSFGHTSCAQKENGGCCAISKIDSTMCSGYATAEEKETTSLSQQLPREIETKKE
jgi:hypothetical protein